MKESKVRVKIAVYNSGVLLDSGWYESTTDWNALQKFIVDYFPEVGDEIKILEIVEE